MAKLYNISLQPLFPRSRYRILGQIGQGQFGRVYCAVERTSGRLYALKDLEHRAFPTNKFLRELTYLVTLRHPHIVACYALEYHATGRYLVMDYCEGGTLRDLMDLEGDIALVHKLQLIQEILWGLEHAHQSQVIHCDLKPENILLVPQAWGWHAKVSDFGIARLTAVTGNPNFCKGYTGSPAYMAPERFYGKFSVASDIYAVGILLYELVVGDRPFSGLPGQLQAAHLNQRLVLPPNVPEPLAPILLKALEKLPQKRFVTAQAMADSLAVVQKKLSPPLCLLSPPPPEKYPLKDIQGQPLAFKASQILVYQQRIYLAMENQLSCWSSQTQLGRITYHSDWDLGFALPIIALQVQAKNILVLTQQDSLARGSATRFYHLHQFSPLSEWKRQKSKIQVSWQTPQLVYGFDPQGEWLATAIPKAEPGQKGIFQLYRSPHWRAIASPLPILFPSQIISLDHRHGLLVFLVQSQGREISVFNLFNRRGKVIRAFSLNFWLCSLVSNPFSRNYLFGLEVRNRAIGILLRLQPLKVIRVALTFAPQFIIAYSWGYLLANTQGQIILLDYEGFYLGEFSVKEPITAITFADKYTCLIATWTGSQGNLYQVDLGEYLEDKIRRKQESR
jgi:serine/threonine-protein kinase